MFGDFLFQYGGFKQRTDFKLADFPRYFTYDKIKSHLDVITTSTERTLQEVLFKEFFPTNKRDEIILGEGNQIDGILDETKFYTWDDLL